MASTSLAKFYEHANRAKATLQRYRAKEKESSTELVVRAGTAAATLGAMCAAGAIDGKWGYDGEKEVHGIATVGPVPINAGAGLVLLAVGIPGILPGSEYITVAGAALLSYPIAKTIEARMQEKAKA
jgi:hypothetical protein